MAKGLIEQSTLTAIGDAIRSKSKTSVRIRPANMAALIEGIGGGEILTGTVTVASARSDISLGVNLPTYSNYCLILCNLKQNSYYGCIKFYFDGTSFEACYVGGSKYTYDAVSIDFANGTVTVGGNYFSGDYRWFYLNLEGAKV